MGVKTQSSFIVVLAFLPWLQVQGQRFTEIHPEVIEPERPGIAWGDYDSDGDLDLLVAGPGRRDTLSTVLYKNTGGDFQDSGLALPGLGNAAAAWGDFDNDGNLDLAMIGQSSSGPVTRVFRNNGTNFTAVAGISSPALAGTVDWADYDNDGDLDLLTTGLVSLAAGSPPATRLYRNDQGTFVSVEHPFPGVSLGAAAWGDYDNDGDLDLFLSGSSNGGLISALFRNDDGTFTNTNAEFPGMDLGFAAWGDCDQDGDLDLALGGNTILGAVTHIYRNSAGVFTETDAGLIGLLWSSGAWGDCDQDGDLDLMIAGYDPETQNPLCRLYRQDSGVFVDSGQSFHNLLLGWVIWMDYNSDNRLDLTLAGNEGNNEGNFLLIYRNESAADNSPPNPPVEPKASIEGTEVRLSWAPATDAETPAAALTYNVRLGTTPGGGEVIAAHSLPNGRRQIAEMGNAQSRLEMRVRGLKPGVQYFWSVQAIDSALAGSEFTAETSFGIPDTAPGLIGIFKAPGPAVTAVWSGTAGSGYQVWASEDLQTWNVLATVTADPDGRIEHSETAGATSARFFVIQPAPANAAAE